MTDSDPISSNGPARYGDSLTVTKEIKLPNVNKLLEHRLNILETRRLLRFDIERKCYNQNRPTITRAAAAGTTNREQNTGGTRQGCRACFRSLFLKI